MTERGRPMLAEPALARQILENVATRSRPFKTEIAIENTVGRVRLTSREPSP
jgi:hypothetical protein